MVCMTVLAKQLHISRQILTRRHRVLAIVIIMLNQSGAEHRFLQTEQLRAELYPGEAVKRMLFVMR